VILFDTSVLIAHLRGVEEASRLLTDAVRANTASCSVLTRVEIEGGMRSDERFAVRRLMGVLRAEPVTEEIAIRAGELLREYRRSHPGIDVVDYVIAATAELRDAELATLNVKHFPMIDGIGPPY
jgi:predicted nucleic acid-binding protein